MKVLILDVSAPYSVDATLAGLRRIHPDADLTILSTSSIESANRTIKAGPRIRDMTRALRALGAERFDYTAIPYRPRFLAQPRYLLSLTLMLLQGRGKRTFLLASGDVGRLVSPVNAFLFNPFWPWIWGPLIAIGIIATRPYYFVVQIIRRFILTREDRNDEFVGFGTGKSQGGLVYWLTIVKQAARYGLFGIADKTYFGIPVSVHTFPLSILALKYLRYRGLIYLSAALISVGLAWISFDSGHLKMLWFIPVVLLSTYFIEHIYAGTWEPLAWGFSVLACGAMLHGWFVIAAVFLAATLASHVGVALLTALMLGVVILLKQASLGSVISFSLTALALSLWYIVPFVRSRDKLGRTTQLKTIWKGSLLSPEFIYQTVLYSVFVVSALVTRTASIFVVILLLPLLVSLYNEFVTWIFSPYTIRTFMLLSGAIFLSVHPLLAPALVYLILVYTSPATMSPDFGGLWGDDLTPVTMGRNRQEILRAFRPLNEGRVGFENPLREFLLPYARAGISYILAGENVDLLNTNFAETGDNRIFEEYVRYFNSGAGRDEFELSCRNAGVKYMVAFSDEFRSLLKSWNYEERERLMQIPFTPGHHKTSFDISIFELPWEASAITPPAKLTLANNVLEFSAEAGATYKLSYSCYRGWRASQNGKPLKIEEANPGMILRVPESGPVELRYSYWNYWR